MTNLFQQFMAIIISFVALFTSTPAPEVAVLPSNSPVVMASVPSNTLIPSVSPKPVLTPKSKPEPVIFSPVYIPTPSPTPDIQKLEREVEELKQKIATVPTPQIIYVTPKPTPRPTSIPLMNIKNFKISNQGPYFSEWITISWETYNTSECMLIGRLWETDDLERNLMEFKVPLSGEIKKQGGNITYADGGWVHLYCRNKEGSAIWSSLEYHIYPDPKPL